MSIHRFETFRLQFFNSLGVAMPHLAALVNFLSPTSRSEVDATLFGSRATLEKKFAYTGQYHGAKS